MSEKSVNSRLRECFSLDSLDFVKLDIWRINIWKQADCFSWKLTHGRCWDLWEYLWPKTPMRSDHFDANENKETKNYETRISCNNYASLQFIGQELSSVKIRKKFFCRFLEVFPLMSVRLNRWDNPLPFKWKAEHVGGISNFLVTLF